MFSQTIEINEEKKQKYPQSDFHINKQLHMVTSLPYTKYMWSKSELFYDTNNNRPVMYTDVSTEV